MRRQFPQFPLPALPFPDHLIGPPHQRYEIIVRPYGRRRPVILSRRNKGARNGVSNFSARRLLAATEEPIAGRAGGAGERRRWRCCARSVDVDEHDADPFSTKAGTHTPQHCSGLSSDNGASAAVSALKGALALVAESSASFVTRCPTMEVLGSRWRERGAKRPMGYLASALGEADTLRTVLDQAQHLEAQALHGGDRWGRRRSAGDGAQDLVFLGAEL